MSTLKAVIDFFVTEPDARERYLGVIVDILKFSASRGTIDSGASEREQHRFAGSEAQSASVSDDQLAKYLEVLFHSGVFREKPEPMELSKTVVELTGKTAQFADCAFAIQEFYSDLNEVARITAQDRVSDKERQTDDILALVFKRADELAHANKGGNLPKGTSKKEQVTVRLDGDVVDWLKSKGPRHNARINGMLRALMEQEENDFPQP